jgi:dolichol-phosphate mannosyltransferase
VISVVAPIFNERENLPEFRRRVSAALDLTGLTWEIVLINDGSRDDSGQIIRQMHADDPRIKLVELSRNFGHQPAVSAGLAFASGDAVILIDGDLQDPPEVIPEMVKKWQAGAQVVLGQRRTRADSGLRGIGFRLFYPVMRNMTDLPGGTPDSGIFGLMDRRVVDELNKLPERRRFIPGLRSWLGFTQDSVLYDRTERAAGKPKQSLRRLVHYAMDAIFSFSTRPLRWVTWLGIFVSTITFGMAIFYLVRFLYGVGLPYGQGWWSLIFSILFLGGVQMISIGILGEYIGRIYEEIKQRPLYIVRERVGLDDLKDSYPASAIDRSEGNPHARSSDDK